MYYAYGDYVYALLSYSSEFLWSSIFVKFAVSDYKNLSKFSCQQPIYSTGHFKTSESQKSGKITKA